jgi:hypothetical protein
MAPSVLFGVSGGAISKLGGKEEGKGVTNCCKKCFRNDYFTR